MTFHEHVFSRPLCNLAVMRLQRQAIIPGIGRVQVVEMLLPAEQSMSRVDGTITPLYAGGGVENVHVHFQPSKQGQRTILTPNKK